MQGTVVPWYLVPADKPDPNSWLQNAFGTWSGILRQHVCESRSVPPAPYDSSRRETCNTPETCLKHCAVWKASALSPYQAVAKAWVTRCIMFHKRCLGAADTHVRENWGTYSIMAQLDAPSWAYPRHRRKSEITEGKDIQLLCTLAVT